MNNLTKLMLFGEKTRIFEIFNNLRKGKIQKLKAEN